MLPASKELNDITMEDYFNNIPNSKYIKYGFSNIGTVLLTSDINTKNYTVLPFRFENEQLYSYILTLYKKIYLSKINFNLDKENSEEEFVDFTKTLWIEETTNDETGKQLEKNWEDKLNIEKTFNKIKNKCDMIYKSGNIEKTRIKQNIIILILVAIGLMIFYGLIN